MRFLSINIESFCSIGSASVQLAEQGLVVVAGRNLDAEAANSNGSGKSTVVVDSICWALFGKTTKGGPADAVTPGGKGKGTRVSLTFESGGHTYIVSRHRKHPTHANRLIIEQDGQDISKATADDSEKLLQSILGITFDTFLYTTILGQGMMFRFTQLTDQQRKEILEGIAATTIYESARVAARDASKNCATEITTATQVGQTMRSSLATLQRQCAETKIKQDEAAAVVEKEKQSINIQVSALDPQIALNQSELDRILALPNDAALQSTLREVEQKALTAMYSAGSQLTVAKSELARQKTSLSDLSKVLSSPVCSACGSTLTEEHRVKEEGIRKAQIAQAETAVEAAKLASDTASATHEKLAAELANIANLERDRNLKIQNLQGTLRNLQHQKDLLVSRLAAADASKPNFNSILENLAVSEKAQEASIHANDAKIAGLAKKKESYDFWITGFQDIRVAAIDSLLTFLNSRLAYYVDTLCGKDITVTLSHNEKGKIDLDVTTGGGTYLSASGGEKDRVDIAMAFALLDLARQCTNWSSNILVLDEIAVYVDDAGIQRFMKVVQDMMGSVESCFLISHSPIFEGYGEKLLTVTKQSGISTVSAA